MDFRVVCSSEEPEFPFDQSTFHRVTQQIMMVSLYCGRISLPQKQHRTVLQTNKELDLDDGARRRPKHNILDICNILTTVCPIKQAEGTFANRAQISKSEGYDRFCSETSWFIYCVLLLTLTTLKQVMELINIDKRRRHNRS